MKNRTFILAIFAIVALFVVALALYGVSMALNPGDSQQKTPEQNESQDAGPGTDTPAGDMPADASGNVRTAFGSLSNASRDPAVVGWLADKTTVYVTGIASDFCSDGESDQWTITYTSDKGQYIVFVAGGSILEARDSQSAQQQGIDPRCLIDSDQAWQIATRDVAASGGTLSGQAAMKLVIDDDVPCWDISYQAPDGFHILRIDAANATISERAIVG